MFHNKSFNMSNLIVFAKIFNEANKNQKIYVLQSR